MNINETCTGCRECLPYCTQGAIFMDAEQAVVDEALCVECGVCIDTDICSVSAFEEDPDEIAEFKKPFGRLLSKHLGSKNVAEGSGYDVKTNDATGKLPTDKLVMRLELARPRGGLKFGDIEQMRLGMEKLGWDCGIGSRSRSIRGNGLSDKIVDQRILTCHLEIVLEPEKIPEIVKDATQFVTERDLWVSINLAGLAETIDQAQKVLAAANLKVEPVAKVNLGLGRGQ